MSEDVPEVPCPYVGLAPFREADQEFFFGREREQRVITANLLSSPLTILYGPSGVGKSSLLMAGVLPHIRRDYPRAPVVLLRDWSAPDLGAALARACMAAIGRAEDGFEVPAGGLPFDERLRLCAQTAGDTMLVIFDQFEEYFLYHQKSTDPASFEAQLARAVNREDVDVGFMFALREDSLAKLDRFRERIPNLLSNRLVLRHLDQAGAAEAIRRPLAVWNQRYGGGNPEVTIEDTLIAELIREVEIGRIVIDEAGGSGGAGGEEAAVEAPFLQLVLTRLWDEELRPPPGETGAGAGGLRGGARVLRLETLTEMGGSQEIVRRHLADVMDGLDAPSRELCASFFDRLVTPSGGKIACREDDLVDYCREAGTGDAAGDEALVRRVSEVLEALCRNRILRTTAESAEQPHATSYEIYHDVLAPAVLSWRARYIGEQRQERERADLARQAREAEARAREKEVTNRRLVRLQWLMLVAFVLVATTAAWALYKGDVAKQQEQIAKDKAREAREQAQIAEERKQMAITGQRKAEVYAEIGEAWANRDRPDRAARFGVQALDRARSERFADALPRAEDVLRRALDHPLEWARVDNGKIAAVLYDPSGRWVASASGKLVRFWDAATGTPDPRPPLEHDGRVTHMVLTRDGKRLVTADADGTLYLRDLAAGPDGPVLQLRHGSELTAMAAGPGGLLATGSRDGRVLIWDLERDPEGSDPVALPKREQHGRWVSDLAFDPDGRRIVVGDLDRGESEVWDLRTIGKSVAKPLVLLPARRSSGTGGADTKVGILADAVAFSPDGRRVAIGGRDGSVILCDARTGSPVATLWGHTGQITRVGFSRGGSRIASASSDRTLRVWENETGRPLLTLTGHESIVDDLAFSPDGGRLVSGGRDQQVRVWDVGVHAGAATAVAFHPDGRHLVSGGSDGSLRLWDTDTRAQLLSFQGHPEPVGEVAFDSDGRSFASAGWDGTLRLWAWPADPGNSARSAAVLPSRAFSDRNDRKDKFYDVAFSRDGRWIAAAGANGNAVVWDIDVPDRRRFAGKHAGQVWGVAFSPTDDYLASVGGDGFLKLWQVPSGRLVGCVSNPDLSPDKREVSDVDFSPDGKRLVMATGRRTLLTVDLADLTRPAGAACPPAVESNFPENERTGGSRAKFMRDGERVVTYGLSRERIWKPGASDDPHTVSAHRGKVNDAALDRAGHWLATAGEDGAVQWHPVDDAELLRLGCTRASPPLDREECRDLLGANECPADPCPGHL